LGEFPAFVIRSRTQLIADNSFDLTISAFNGVPDICLLLVECCKGPIADLVHAKTLVVEIKLSICVESALAAVTVGIQKNV
jgi:hypothetical protein